MAEKSPEYARYHQADDRTDAEVQPGKRAADVGIKSFEE